MPQVQCCEILDIMLFNGFLAFHRFDDVGLLGYVILLWLGGVKGSGMLMTECYISKKLLATHFYLNQETSNISSLINYQADKKNFDNPIRAVVHITIKID